MDILKKLFPHAFKCKKSEVGNFVITLILYLVFGIIAGAVIWVAGLLTGIPVLGFILALVLRILGSLVDLYVIVGVILSILCFLEILK
ncbi:MAG: hypothetical protein E7616_08155 [Ruminococcaceae bacterium]|nr:hypothetical protein [Oscillospiraceae bacterium]